jgi:methylated-DNA-[protein]-cysteine S-methyltransferase
MKLTFRIVETRAGMVGYVAGSAGLKRFYLPEAGAAAGLRRRIRSDYPDATEDDALLPKLAAAVRRYFAGDPVEFKAAYDWNGRGAFETAVWKACAAIPYGRTRTYGELARAVGAPKAARAVGMAMSQNPLPILVPCHRVLRSDGSLGGYSGPGGTGFKRRLLEMEAQRAAR